MIALPFAQAAKLLCILLPYSLAPNPFLPFLPFPSVDDIRKDLFQSLHRVVVKVGTKILVGDDNAPSWDQLNHLVAQLSLLHDEGYAVVLVTSGAVGVGMSILGYSTRPKELPEKQACAAIGQIRLMHMYSESFAKRGKTVAQILLSGDDFPRFVGIQQIDLSA